MKQVVPGTPVEARKTISADGVDLTYLIHRCGRSDAPALLLLHGAASNHTRWSEFLELTDLTGSCDTIRPDLRGNGDSMWRGRLDLDVWTADLLAILEHERISQSILIGHSLGAQLALQVAARSPSVTRGLVLIEPVFPAALLGGRRLMWRWRALLELATRGLMMVNRWGLGRRSFPSRDLRELDRETRRELAASGDTARLAKKYSSLRYILPYLPTANYLQELAATVAPLPPLENISRPVLVMLAAGTSIANQTVLEREIERLPAADVVSVEADHWPLTERPIEVCREVERWLAARRLVG